MKVTRAVLDHVAQAALIAAPRECCGLLLGEADRIASSVETANVAADPLQHFEIDPMALIAAHRHARAGGPAVVGYYHSHPNGLARPSATDCRHATGDGRIWAIVTQDGVTFWRDLPDGFAPVECDVVEG